VEGRGAGEGVAAVAGEREAGEMRQRGRETMVTTTTTSSSSSSSSSSSRSSSGVRAKEVKGLRRN